MGPAALHSGRPSLGTSVYDIVKDLQADVESLAFPISVDGAAQAAEQRTLLLAQLEDHLIPRLAELSTPGIIVVAGSTGAGKSTITNSLVGEDVSAAGLLRPTTVEPVLVVHPLDEELMRASSLVEAVKIVTHEAVPRGIAILDAPDLDSVRDDNRATARRLLESADLWLFVTTSRRYGDALPWKTLTSATERGTSVAMILNRAPKASLADVRMDLLTRLREHGMERTPLFVIEDIGPHEGLLPEEAVRPVRNWLTTLSGADQARAVIVRTLRGSLEALPPRLNELAQAIDQQVSAKDLINSRAKEVLVECVTDIRSSLADKALLGGAGAAQWSLLATSSRYDKIVGRSGYAKGSPFLRTRRADSAARAEESFKDIAEQAALDVLASARTRVSDALAGVRGGEFVELSEFPDRSEDVRSAVDDWAHQHHLLVSKFLETSSSKQVDAATRALDSKSLDAITIAAALGVAPAADLARRLLGNEIEDVLAASTAVLADEYDQLILAEYQHIHESLARLDLEEGASARIRVRVAELKALR